MVPESAGDTVLDHTAALRAAAGSVHRQFDGAATFDAFFASWSAAQARYYPLFLSGELSIDLETRNRED